MKSNTQSNRTEKPREEAHVARPGDDGPVCYVLICDSPLNGSPPLRVLLDEVPVAVDPIHRMEGLRALVERHSPALALFTRAGLDRLVARDGALQCDISLGSRIGETWPRLSPVNAQIVELVAKGLRNSEIERATGIKARTIRAHLSQLYREFEVTNRTELVGALIERGISF